ncbi:hypothetical protein BX600DRAFT_432095 [Xylariales sp. PMI_506]|nr:hypothetical protein BX600DRAFT_432095 [Xylariales sp. PMI_506]
MPRFPKNFRRRSTVTEDQNGPVEPSFRVLERVDASAGKSFDGGVRMAMGAGPRHKSTFSELTTEDNMFADLKTNRPPLLHHQDSDQWPTRGSGGSNTTKAPSDNSSRRSNASTAPSSTDQAAHDEWRQTARKPVPEVSTPTRPKSSNSNGFLKQAGRTFSFGKKQSSPPIPQEPVPPVPDDFEARVHTPGGRSRAPTTSTVTSATPPKVEDRDFLLDLGGDLSNMLSAFNKRSSVATMRNLTGNRASQPSPLHLDHNTKVEPSPRSWNSQRSDEGLLGSERTITSPPLPSQAVSPPPVPNHARSPISRSKSEDEDENARLLKDSLAATRFLAGNGGSQNEDGVGSLKESYARPSRYENRGAEDNLFDNSFSRSRFASRPINRSQTAPPNKVMTPAEFERYRQDKVKSMASDDNRNSDSEEDDKYDDDEDDREKTKELAKQRNKQEAHMTVYRQQMMKVTGEQPGQASRPSFLMSMSTPNLLLDPGKGASGSTSPRSAEESEDEEVPLAILAAHGFPNKNRPPTRLSTVGSNPNLRASVQPSYIAGPGSAAGDAPPRPAGGHLPAFARKLPQDPFLGAGLVNQPPREAFALGGGTPANLQNRPVPVGGLVGVIANEERARAMRRGSPAADHAKNMSAQMQMNGAYDPMAQIPPQMMYPMGMQQMGPMLTPGDQAQIQMTQQMQQFMQMQMQFMQMMSGGQNPGQMPPQMPMPMQMQMPTQPPARPMSHMPRPSMNSLPDVQRASFLGDPMTMGMGMGMGNGMGLEPPRGDMQMRTMSMVQPSSASWIQPPQAGYAPSIRMQGGGYAPSIAPSERSNIGLPGRYRPVSSLNPLDAAPRTHTMSGALPTLSKLGQTETTVLPARENDEDDDEEGWAAMKASREKKKSGWRLKKSLGAEIGALIS